MIIKNIMLIDPASNTQGIRDIYIDDGKITKIVDNGAEDATPEAEQAEGAVFDGTGLVAAPGLVDVHVHFRDPGFEYKEDIFTGAKSAAAGGFTSVVMMANTKPAIDNVDTLKAVLEKASKTDINVYTCADITEGLKGLNVTDMALLLSEGAVGFTDDGIPIKDAGVVEEAMKLAAELDVPLSFHEEDPAYISENGINSDKAAKHFGIKGSPRQAEISLIERDVKIAENIPVKVLIQHISSAEGVEIVRQAKKTNPNVFAELTPHHFSLNEDAVIAKGTLAKMNPPLRTENDRLALIQGLLDDTIEIISTDHAPHSVEEKAKELTQAPSGIIGLETSLGLGVTNLVKAGHLSLMKLLEKMTVNPAGLYKLDAGRIYEGGPADLVIFNPDEQWIVPEKFESKSCNTPFVGEKLYGKIHMTICKGQIVYRQ